MAKQGKQGRFVNWFFGYLLVLLLSSGCQYHPKNKGQQYYDGKMEYLFNLSQPHLGRPVNIAAYLQQIEIIKQVSPSLYKKNALIYKAINQWINHKLSTHELNQVGLSNYQLMGQDQWGNVQLTGYYTPVIKARRIPDDQYRYPLYAMPDTEPLPTRAEIYQGALDGQQLEIAYTDSLIDNFIMEIQGSGYIDFEDGSPIVFFGYNGKNGHPYKSIGRVLIEQGEIEREKMSMQAIKGWTEHQDQQTIKNLLSQNPSAVFFKPQDNGLVIGSEGIPLIAKASVAVDKSLIPPGSVLFIDVPLLDEKGKYNGQRELRLVVALDIGGAIKGQHLDLYQGIGDDAGYLAGFYNHYGRVWLIAPAPNSHLASPKRNYH